MRKTCFLAFACLIVCASGFAKDSRKNVLLLMADDFNHWLPKIGYYPSAKTPNLDRLADRGVLFADAQNSSPVCNPSRNAIFSGLRPVTSGISANSHGFVREQEGLEHIVSLHQHFLNNGYYTYGAGKLWHPGRMGAPNTDPENWTDIYRGGTGSPGGDYNRFESGYRGYSWSGGEFNLQDDAADTIMAHHIAELIENMQDDQPFFIACGFFRPHLPWHVHKRFWDLYEEEDIVIPQGYREDDLEDLVKKPNNRAIHEQITGEGLWKQGIHAYLANLSYADYNVSIVLDALENSPYAENTIVLFMGDHGWHLGEKNRWSKHDVYDQANRTTFIIYDPSAKGNGQMSRKVVSLQDIYPTLIQLCALPDNPHVEGNDLSPLLSNPNDPDWDKPVLISYQDIHYLKTNEWKWIPDGEASQLYDVVNDPYEWNNLYGKPEYAQIAAKLDAIVQREIRRGEALRVKIASELTF